MAIAVFDTAFSFCEDSVYILPQPSTLAFPSTLAESEAWRSCTVLKYQNGAFSTLIISRTLQTAIHPYNISFPFSYLAIWSGLSDW